MSKPVRILAVDTSLGTPGIAVIEVKNGKPRIIDKSHVKTDSKQPLALRTAIVQSWATLFIDKHRKKGFDVIIREDFQGRSSAQNYPVFAAWHATEKAVHNFGLSFDKYVSYTQKGKRKSAHGISQSRMKLLTVGKGQKVSKDEIADAVRDFTGFTGEFGDDGESDACAIGIATAIQLGLVDDKHGKLNEYDRNNFDSTDGLR